MKYSSGALNRTGLLKFIPKKSWERMSMPAKSDVIRVFLLYNYGGVWLDATVCLTESLLTWLNMDVDFTTFIRHDSVAEKGTAVLRSQLNMCKNISMPVYIQHYSSNAFDKMILYISEKVLFDHGLPLGSWSPHLKEQ